MTEQIDQTTEAQQDLFKLTRPDLNAYAAEQGIANPDSYSNKADLIAALSGQVAADDTTIAADPPVEPEPSVESVVAPLPDLTLRRRLHDQHSGNNVDRFRQEVIANARRLGYRVLRLVETADPPLGSAPIEGQRWWTIAPEVAKD